MASPYPALLTLHLLAVAIFAGGLVLAASVLPGLTRAPHGEAGRREAARLLAIARFVTTPALALVWACGIAMAVRAGWFAMGWLKMKAAIVVALSVLHARQADTLARLARSDAVRPAWRWTLPALAMAFAAIVALVVAKPF